MDVTRGEKVALISEDGVPFRITLFRYRSDSSPVVIIMPAMGVRASFYEPLAQALVEAGFHALTADLRGHGESGIRPGRKTDFGYGEMVKYDWPCVMAEAGMQFPRSSKIILGHSLGGQLSTLYMSENPTAIDRLVLVASPGLYYRDWPFPRSVSLLFSTQLFALLARVMGYYPGHRIGIGGTEARGLVRDWARIVRKGRYDMIHRSHDYVALLQGLRVPLLALSFTDDPFARKRAVDGLCAKMPRIELTRWHLAPPEIGCRELGHFNWVNKSGRLVPLIAKWLRGDETQEGTKSG
jgi:predicted alpha/beta hydrolase